jgi:hypothetical protein
MTSASVSGMYSYSNLHYLSLPGALRLSPYYGGGLGALFYLTVGLADTLRQRAYTSPFFPHLIQRYVSATSWFLVRPQLLNRSASLPIGRDIFLIPGTSSICVSPYEVKPSR